MKAVYDWQGKIVSIGIASDHGGFEQKKTILEMLTELGLEPVDYGPFAHESEDDYPDFGAAMAMAVSKGEVACGILLCRSGVGMGIVANRFNGVRAVIGSSEDVVKASREHNCSNVLVIPSDYQDQDASLKIINTWLNTPAIPETRHQRRIRKIETSTYDQVAAVRNVDPEIAGVIDEEISRQNGGLELIASENFASAAVCAAQGSVLTNKYAEGYPGKRYYNGCECVDKAENIAIERACELFGAEAANVQPHSGSQANMAAYFSLVELGDTILAMDLAHGGHLTHGHPVNFSGMLYDFKSYGVSADTEQIDYDNVRELAEKYRPKLIVAGASAYSRIIDFEKLRETADAVGAKLMVDMAHIAGLVAAGLHPSPVPYCEVVTSTTHKTLRGPRSGLILCREEYIKKINSKVFPCMQGGPMMHTIAAKAVCFGEAMSNEFKLYQRQVVKNASHLAEELEKKGFRIVSGGTDNHLMLVDLRPKNSTGKAVALALDKAAVTVNKNMIPFDPETPFVTSGIRIGTPAVTTRGMKEQEMTKIACWIEKAVAGMEDERTLESVAGEIREFMREFPLPQFV